MVIITHCYTRPHDLDKKMGMPDYSYRFVLDRFRPVLERIAPVTEVVRPGVEIDAIHEFARAIEHDSVFLSFNPLQQTLTDLSCPKIPVFAWEFDDLPDGAWGEDPREQWRYVLEQCGSCITHSSHAATVVRAGMGEDFPVAAIAAPLPAHFENAKPDWRVEPLDLSFEGKLTDSSQVATGKSKSFAVKASSSIDLAGAFSLPGRMQARRPAVQHVATETDSVVYTAVFNPRDGRKNWRDMVNAFCAALRNENATLVLKVFGSHTQKFHSELSAMLKRLSPMTCRVLAIDGLLDEEGYLGLALASHFGINTSHGEGQCLPLMEYMALGKPAVAPAHTGMLDYVNTDNGFPYRTTAEPASWPQDPTHRVTTWRQRIDMESLNLAISESYQSVRDGEDYRKRSEKAAAGIREWAGADVVESKLRAFLNISEQIAA